MAEINDFNEIKTIDIWKHLIFKLGQDFNGNFYPNHIDFYICFGTWHTEKGCIYIAIIMLLIFLADFITLFIMNVWYMVPVFFILCIVEIILIYAIKKDNRFLILPHLILSTLSIIFSLVIMCVIIMSITDSNSAVFKWVMTIFAMSDMNTILVCLLVCFFLGITIIIQMWVNWTLYVHYCYLRNVKIFGCGGLSREDRQIKVFHQDFVV